MPPKREREEPDAAPRKAPAERVLPVARIARPIVTMNDMLGMYTEYRNANYSRRQQLISDYIGVNVIPDLNQRGIPIHLVEHIAGFAGYNFNSNNQLQANVPQLHELTRVSDLVVEQSAREHRARRRNEQVSKVDGLPLQENDVMLRLEDTHHDDMGATQIRVLNETELAQRRRMEPLRGIFFRGTDLPQGQTYLATVGHETVSNNPDFMNMVENTHRSMRSLVGHQNLPSVYHHLPPSYENQNEYDQPDRLQRDRRYYADAPQYLRDTSFLPDNAAGSTTNDAVSRLVPTRSGIYTPTPLAMLPRQLPAQVPPSLGMHHRIVSQPASIRREVRETQSSPVIAPPSQNPRSHHQSKSSS
jgi:hypothetical protein